MELLKTILIIDENVAFCQLFATLLERDYNVRCVHAADEAAQAIADLCPSLILCHARLPKMSGYALAKELTDNPATASIPVVLMSGWEDGTCEERARQAGAVAFLPKPFLLQELRELVATHTGHFSLAA